METVICLKQNFGMLLLITVLFVIVFNAGVLTGSGYFHQGIYGTSNEIVSNRKQSSNVSKKRHTDTSSNKIRASDIPNDKGYRDLRAKQDDKALGRAVDSFDNTNTNTSIKKSLFDPATNSNAVAILSDLLQQLADKNKAEQAKSKPDFSDNPELTDAHSNKSPAVKSKNQSDSSRYTDLTDSENASNEKIDELAIETPTSTSTSDLTTEETSPSTNSLSTTAYVSDSDPSADVESLDELVATLPTTTTITDLSRLSDDSKQVSSSKILFNSSLMLLKNSSKSASSKSSENLKSSSAVILAVNSSIASEVIDADNNNEPALKMEQARCGSTIYSVLDETIDAVSLKKVFRACLYNTTAKIDKEPEAFRALFTEQNFKFVYCPARSVTFSEFRRPAVALASFPGSGNTWVRHLVEQLTGIATGSVFDGFIRKTFKGEKLCPTDKEVFVIKTHFASNRISRQKRKCTRKRVPYKKAVLILRNPYDAILAEYNRRHGGKKGYAKEILFYGQGWQHFVKKSSKIWAHHSEYWIKEFRGPRHILFNEALKQNTAYELYKLAEFLEFPATYRTLWCTLDNKDGRFYRLKPDWLKQTRLYSTDVEEYVDRSIAYVKNLLKETNENVPDYRYMYNAT